MIGYGSNGYAVAEPVGKTPRDFGKNRPCGMCGKPGLVNRYAEPVRVSPNVRLLLCPDCRNESSAEASIRAPKTRPPKRRTNFSRVGGKGRVAGKKLVGLARLIETGGWTHAELARQSGVSAAYIGDLKRLDRGASMETMERLAKALGVEVEELVK